MASELFNLLVAYMGTVMGIEDKGKQPSNSDFTHVFEHPDVHIRVLIDEAVNAPEGSLNCHIISIQGYVRGRSGEMVKEVIADVMQALAKATKGTNRITNLYCLGNQTTVDGVYNNLFTRP